MALNKSVPEEAIRVEPARTLIKAGTLEVDVDATGFGSIKVDGKPLAVREMTVHVRAGEVVRADMTVLPLAMLPETRDGFKTTLPPALVEKAKETPSITLQVKKVPLGVPVAKEYLDVLALDRRLRQAAWEKFKKDALRLDAEMTGEAAGDKGGALVIPGPPTEINAVGFSWAKAKPDAKPCTCPAAQLMTTGCTCGAISKPQA